MSSLIIRQHDNSQMCTSQRSNQSINLWFNNKTEWQTMWQLPTEHITVANQTQGHLIYTCFPKSTVPHHTLSQSMKRQNFKIMISPQNESQSACFSCITPRRQAHPPHNYVWLLRERLHLRYEENDHAKFVRKDHPWFEEIEQRHERKEHPIMLTLQGKITLGLKK